MDTFSTGRPDICMQCIHENMCEKYANYTKECLDFLNKDDFVKINHGEWVDAWGNDKCTVCGFECGDPYYLGQANHCPECGSKMTRKDYHNGL